MGLIKYTKDFSASDNGSSISGVDMQNLQGDISAVINSNITNVNIASGAAIDESKIAFDTTSGHTHNGTDAAYPLIKHYRKGLILKSGTTAATDIKVTPGVIDIGGKLLISTADSSNIDISDGGNYLGGQSEPADGPVYVYGYDNSGALGIKLSTLYPELSDSDGNTAEFPLRYHLDSAIYYRLIGILHNRVSIQVDMFNNFDLCNCSSGSFVSDNANETIYTGWTPRFIRTWSPADTAPDDGDAFTNFETFEYGEKTADPHLGGGSATAEVTFMHVGATHNLEAEATAGNITDIIQQSTSSAGAFTVYAPTNSIVVYWIAWTDRI